MSKPFFLLSLHTAALHAQHTLGTVRSGTAAHIHVKSLYTATSASASLEILLFIGKKIQWLTQEKQYYSICGLFFIYFTLGRWLLFDSLATLFNLDAWGMCMVEVLGVCVCVGGGGWEGKALSFAHCLCPSCAVNVLIVGTWEKRKRKTRRMNMDMEWDFKCERG